MENATDALLIAGGILLAIIVISLFVFMMGNISTLQEKQQQVNNNERLSKWNAEWESYNKKYLYGVEVLTVINKAKNSSANGNIVNVIVKNGGAELSASDISSSYKSNIFECKDINYDDSGRVNEMKFIFIE